MNIGFIIIMVIFIILILLGLITIGFYNRILFRKNRVRDKFLVVYNSLKERSNMISRNISYKDIEVEYKINA